MPECLHVSALPARLPACRVEAEAAAEHFATLACDTAVEINLSAKARSASTLRVYRLELVKVGGVEGARHTYCKGEGRVSCGARQVGKHGRI